MTSKDYQPGQSGEIWKKDSPDCDPGWHYRLCWKSAAGAPEIFL